jgi:hypothetical protein
MITDIENVTWKDDEDREKTLVEFNLHIRMAQVASGRTLKDILAERDAENAKKDAEKAK